MALNPRGDVIVCESLAALLYLDDTYPEHPLLPSGSKERALVSQYAREEFLTVLRIKIYMCRWPGDSGFRRL